MPPSLPPTEQLTDARDRIVFAQTPLVPMPRFSALVPLEVGRRRYIGAADGIYVQARHPALSLTLPVPQLPFGRLKPEVHLPGGLIPRALYEDIERRALARAPTEWAGLVHWNAEQGYTLIEPPALQREATRISYTTDQLDRDCLVLDIHSHGYGKAFFSDIDDESDAYGVHFSTVLGRCQSRQTLQAKTRIVIDGQFFDIDWHPWEDG